ncbi:GNAT family N-acetyltransferase [Hwanghaeella grinnelliae]|nr:GNAT family N-acetyltransferase [Hwanghaeella grinnelliae]
MDLRVDSVEPEEASAFASLTFPRYRKFLASGIAESDLFVLGAWVDDRPVGLLIARSSKPDEIVELLSISTHRAHRRRGIASALLDSLEARLAGKPYSRLVTSFTQVAGNEASLAPVLRHKGWSIPVMQMKLFDLSVDAVFTSSWVESVSSGPARFDIRDFDPGQSGDLEVISLENWVPRELAPVKHMYKGLDGAAILTPASFVFYEDDVIAGWHFSHQLDSETIRFSVSYVHPDIQQDLVLLDLWHKAALAARELGYKRIKFGVAAHHRKMLSFCSSFLGPISDRVSLSLSSYRKIHFDDVWA